MNYGRFTPVDNLNYTNLTAIANHLREIQTLCRSKYGDIQIYIPTFDSRGLIYADDIQAFWTALRILNENSVNIPLTYRDIKAYNYIKLEDFNLLLESMENLYEAVRTSTIKKDLRHLSWVLGERGDDL